MMKSFGIALALVVILGSVWLLFDRERAALEEGVGEVASQAEGEWVFPAVEDAARIEVGLREAIAVFERADGEWWMVLPLRDRMDPSSARELEELVREPPVIDRRRPLGDAHALGLGMNSRRPALRYLDAEGEVLVGFVVGARVEQADADRVLTWVEPEGAGEIVRAGRDLRPVMERDLGSFRDRQLLRVPVEEVVRVDQITPDGGWVLLRAEGGWTLVAGDRREEASDERVHALLEGLTTARAGGFLPAGADRAAHGIAEPRAEVTITLEEGGTASLLLGDALDGGEGGEATRWAIGRGDALLMWEVPAEVRALMMRTADWLVGAGESADGDGG